MGTCPGAPSTLLARAACLVFLERCASAWAAMGVACCRAQSSKSQNLRHELQVQAKVAGTCGPERQEALRAASAHRDQATAVLGEG